MKESLAGRWSKAWKILRGAAESAPPPQQPPDALRTALLEKEREVAALKAEYARLQSAASADAAAETRENVKDALKRVAPPLSQLAATRADAEAGVAVRLEDVMKLVKALETALARAGLEPVGGAGEATAFSARLHQRLSGGDVREGHPVRVEFPGYRIGGDVVLKAMVKREGGA